MKEKAPLSHEVECFPMLDFKTSKSNSERSQNQVHGKLLLSRKLHVRSEGVEPFLTMFYTSTSPQLLLTK